MDQAKYQLCFDPDNDSFLIADDVSDGRRAVVHWNAWDGSGREGECADTNGALNGWTVCDYDFIEGRTNYVAFQGMTRNGANGSNSDNSWVYNGYITPR
ncbi:hypothetical protein GTW64_27820 [Streptomyces sp. SID4923]|nr:hypothetical protein [Streptomyces sp. SID4923]